MIATTIYRALCAVWDLLEKLANPRQTAELMRNCAALIWWCNHDNASPCNTTCIAGCFISPYMPMLLCVNIRGTGYQACCQHLDTMPQAAAP